MTGRNLTILINAQLDPTAGMGGVAEALRRMQTDAALREDLRQRGIERLRQFSWEHTARAHRALYRQAARRPLSEDDLLALRRVTAGGATPR